MSIMYLFLYGIDLSGKAYIQVLGIDIFGTGIKTDDSTNNILVKNMKGEYISHCMRNLGGSPGDDNNGILVRGFNNEINSCEFEYGQKDFKAGHDFANPPVVIFNPAKTTFFDYIENGGFETGNISTWNTTGNDSVKIFYDDMGAWVKKEAANARTQDYSLRIKGNGADWDSIGSIATASGQCATSLKVRDDNTNLYFFIQDIDLKPYTQVHINADNNADTGYMTTGWSSSGFDYMLENYNLFKHPKNSSDFGDWIKVGRDVREIKSASEIEISVAKSALPNLKDTITFAFKSIGADWIEFCSLPVEGSAVLSYTLTGAAAVANNAKGGNNSGIEQVVGNLKPDTTYVVSAWAKSADDASSREVYPGR